MKFRSVFIIVALLAIGCGGRAVIKPEEGAAKLPSATAQVTLTPVTGPKIPALVNVHEDVTDQDYQTALAAIGTAAADHHNLNSHYIVAQYQYNHANLVEALKTFQKILQVPNAASQLDKAQYMVGQIY